MDASSAAWVGERLRLGFQALEAGRPRRAAGHCRDILVRAPKTVQAHFLVGLIALETDDRRNAIHAFGSVTRLDAAHSAAWAHLARLFVLGGQASRADRALREAVRHRSGDPIVQDLIGTVFSLLGEQHQARAWYARAVRGKPTGSQSRVNLANALVFLGDSDAAVAELETVLHQSPRHAQAHWVLASARRARDRAHVDVMARLVSERGLPPRAAAFLHYAIGKELEDLEEWPDAFEAFSRGATARRKTIEYDEAREAAAFRAAEAAFTPEWFAGAKTGVPDDSPIFVVGQPRTGTTLVERVIASHSAAHSAGELQQFGLSIRRLAPAPLGGRFDVTLVESAAKTAPASLGAEYLRATERSRGATPRFVDKLPTNYLYLPLIAKALPNAKIVHLVRDPRDACFAVFKQLFANAYPHSYDQREMANHFVRYHHMMSTWRKRFAGTFHDIHYEDLVADFETEARRLIEYLELPWEDACLRFYEHGGPVATASAAQVREPAHTRSVGRWRKYGQRLQPMLDILTAAGTTSQPHARI